MCRTHTSIANKLKCIAAPGCKLVSIAHHFTCQGHIFRCRPQHLEQKWRWGHLGRVRNALNWISYGCICCKLIGRLEFFEFWAELALHQLNKVLAGFEDSRKQAAKAAWWCLVNARWQKKWLVPYVPWGQIGQVDPRILARPFRSLQGSFWQEPQRPGTWLAKLMSWSVQPNCSLKASVSPPGLQWFRTGTDVSTVDTFDAHWVCFL